MNRDDVFFDPYRDTRSFMVRDPLTLPSDRPPRDDRADFKSVAFSEGWYEPPREVTRVALRPWQQAVFWGLRVYIVVMLVVMVIGFAKVAAGS